MFKLLLVITSYILLVSCSTDGDLRRAEYLDASYLKSLELPPDLIFQDSNKTQLSLPKPTERALHSFKKGLAETIASNPELKKKLSNIQQVAPVFDGIRLKSDGGLSWLEIDEPAAKLWPVLLAFWENEGVSLHRTERVLGYIETDWVVKYQVVEDENFIVQFFTIADKDKVDRFRLRITQGDTASKSNIYISHTGLQNIIDGPDDRHYESRSSEEELEVELLTRLLVYMGLNKQDSSALLSAYKPYSNRAYQLGSSESKLVMTGSMAFVSLRLTHALDRLGLEIDQHDKSRHVLKIIVQQLRAEKIGGEKDELSDSSYIMQLFTGENIDASKDVSRQFILKLTSVGKVVNIELLNLDKEPASSVLASQVLKGLLLELN